MKDAKLQATAIIKFIGLNSIKSQQLWKKSCFIEFIKKSCFIEFIHITNSIYIFEGC